MTGQANGVAPPPRMSDDAPMNGTGNIADIARVIQLATAPVFLLTGIGALINVLNVRLGRSIDRGRLVARRILDGGDQVGREAHDELAMIGRRVKLIYRAINGAVISALLVCVIIAALFISAFEAIPVSRGIGVLFVVAMLALIASLLLFLREVFLATRSLRIGPH
jgi:hypothetical protein